MLVLVLFLGVCMCVHLSVENSVQNERNIWNTSISSSDTVKMSDIVQDSVMVKASDMVQGSDTEQASGTIQGSDTSPPPPSLYVVSDGLQSDGEGELCILLQSAHLTPSTLHPTPYTCTLYTCTPHTKLPPVEGAPLHLIPPFSSPIWNPV